MVTTIQRFYNKVEWASSDQVYDGTPCLLWTASKYPEGYGQAWNGERGILAHKMAWEEAFGPPPTHDEDGNRLDLDHLCHEPSGACPGGRLCVHRPCVNLWHLDLRTHRQNVARGSSPSALLHQAGVCSKGHPQTARASTSSRAAQPDASSARPSYAASRPSEP